MRLFENIGSHIAFSVQGLMYRCDAEVLGVLTKASPRAQWLRETQPYLRCYGRVQEGKGFAGGWVLTYLLGEGLVRQGSRAFTKPERVQRKEWHAQAVEKLRALLADPERCQQLYERQLTAEAL